MKSNIKKSIAMTLTGFLLGTTLTVSAGSWIQAYRNDEITDIKSLRIGEFMTEVFAENEGIHFEYGPNEKYYGFEEDIFGGC